MAVASNDRFLEDMLQRATDPNTEGVDELAVRIFCTVVRNDPSLVGKSTELLVAQIKSPNIKQSLKSLTLLEECMSKCGPEFQKEVSKYRFLNELIRLVSKKFLADETPVPVKEKIMDCLLLWTTQYPDKVKIKEAYDMLRKEGIQCSPITTVSAHSASSSSSKCSIFQNTENEELFKKLVQSSNREDLKKANLLIQHLADQDAKKTELRIQQKCQLEEVQNTVSLLNQIIDSWSENQGDEESLNLMKELHDSCMKYKPILIRMPDTIDENEELLCQTIEVNDALLAVMERYEKCLNSSAVKTQISVQSTLQMDTSDVSNCLSGDDLLADLLGKAIPQSDKKTTDKDLDELNEIFSKTESISASGANPAEIFKNFNLLEPTPVFSNDKQTEQTSSQAVNKKSSALQTIDDISEDLFKENLKTDDRIGSFKKEPTKLSLNELASNKLLKKPPTPVQDETLSPVLDDDLSCLIKKSTHDTTEVQLVTEASPIAEESQLMPDENRNGESKNDLPPKTALRLSDIQIELDDVTPSTEPQRVILEEENGLKVTLDFTLNRPSANVSVCVISVVNHGKLAISNFQVEASVKKPSKLRLLPATGSHLPGVKPFRQPTETINQILLVYNPTGNAVDLTCILSYTSSDDPDPIKDSIIVKSIPYVD